MKKELIEKVTDYIIHCTTEDWAMDIEHFDWVPGVGLYGIFCAWKALGRQEYFTFLERWIERHLPEAYEQKTVNSTAPMLTVIEMYRENRNEAYLKVCEDIAAFIMEEAPLTREGGLEHTVTENVPGFQEQIWADTLFMVCIFLAKLGKETGNAAYTEFALKQLEIHHRVLRDEKSGLYFHGWNCAAASHMSAVHWGRANAWIIFSTAVILETAGKLEEKKEWICAHAEALKKCQRENGAFGTILDDSSSYDETSATAGIAAGLCRARKAGILEAEFDLVIQKALHFIGSQIDQDGAVGGVSTGTPVMPDADAYKAIPCCPTLYGQGLAAIALAE